MIDLGITETMQTVVENGTTVVAPQTVVTEIDLTRTIMKLKEKTATQSRIIILTLAPVTIHVNIAIVKTTIVHLHRTNV